ncbi:VOC family protein [Paramicrobacterium fandaimingii]|uniref:VOC family protein n=1 Tax=Paramicrobacterium fandaimingii TaxID=2708079 RepID=UPI00141EE5B8|nr:VOC family protein [Microbacterium fandaimingii]
MTVVGPSFLALQVRDIERAAEFYETQLGLRRAPQAPPGAVVFMTEPIPFAVREPLPGVDLDSTPRPGLGVALWMSCDAVQNLHDDLASRGTPILRAPEQGPFGLNFTFADLDGYAVTVHEQAPAR